MSAGPSATAGLVVRGVAFQAGHPVNGVLVPEEAARLAERFSRAAGLRLWRGDSALHRAVVALQERLSVPGLTLHYVLRKKMIEEVVRAAIGDGYRQLIVLGAGFDTLAIRLAREVKSVEIDRAETQAVKRVAAPGGSGVSFIAADLARDALRDLLRRCDPLPTVVLAEAVFLYLSDEEVHRVLRDVRESFSPVRVVFTFFGTTTSGRRNFSNATLLADLWLRWKGEPVRWMIDPAEVAAFAAADGFDLLRIIRDEEFHAGRTAARGEHIAVLEGR